MNNAEDEEQAAAALLGLIPHPDHSSQDGSKADRHEAPMKKRKVARSARSSHPEHNDDLQKPAGDRELEDSKTKAKKKRKKRKTHGTVEQKQNYPVPPRVIQLCKVRRTHVNQ